MYLPSTVYLVVGTETEIVSVFTPNTERCNLYFFGGVTWTNVSSTAFGNHAPRSWGKQTSSLRCDGACVHTAPCYPDHYIGPHQDTMWTLASVRDTSRHQTKDTIIMQSHFAFIWTVDYNYQHLLGYWSLTVQKHK